MQNKLEDLTNHLYEQLERLNDDELMEDEEKAKREFRRAASMKEIADELIKIENVKNEKKRIQVNMANMLLENGYEITDEQQSKLIGIEYNEQKNKKRIA